MYTDKPKKFPPLSENKEFNSVRNMIIRTVLKMNIPMYVEHIHDVPKPTDTDHIIQADEQSADSVILNVPDAVVEDTEYSEALHQNSENYEQAMLANTVMSLFTHLSRIIEDDYMRSRRKLRSTVDKKLRRMIDQKKEELGIKSDSTMSLDY